MKPASDATTSELPPLAPGGGARFLDHVIARRFGGLVAPRRHLHFYPESGGREHQTSACLDAFLAPHDFEIRRGPERRGLIVDPPRMATGPRIAIRADLDALFIDDRKECEYRSRRPGAMIRLGRAPSSQQAAPLHSPEFDLDEGAIALDARILARKVVICSDPARHAATGSVMEAADG